MNIAIVGSRDFDRLDLVRYYVESLPPETTIVSGGARGVDRTAEQTARACGLTVVVYHANWEQYGKSAGMIRNQQIIEAADAVVAFWNGTSPGTRNSINRAKKANKPITIIR